MEIPNLALELKKRSQKFHFLITAPLDNSMECRQFNALVQNNKVEDMVSIVGQVKKEELASLYRQINYVFLLSKLESFSNNIIESWFFKKPLIVSDELWSRSICNDAASYVDRNSITDIINKLLELEKNKNLREAIVDNGSKALQTYPTIEEKIKEEVRYLKYVYENN